MKLISLIFICLILSISLSNITGFLRDHFAGKHNHSAYGLIDLNDSGKNNFTNMTQTEFTHLSDIEEDNIVLDSEG